MSSREAVLGPEDLPADVPQGQTEAVVKQQGLGSAIKSGLGSALSGFGFGSRTTDPERLARQQEMDQLARTQLGDSVVDRYGDVLGTRDRGFRDFLRDLATNEVSGDLTKSSQVATQVQEAFAKGVQRSIENDRAARTEATQRLDTWFQGVTKAQKIKVPGLQKQYLQALGEQTGIPISKEVAGLLASGGIPTEVFSDPQFQELLQEDPVGAVAQLQAAGVDVIAAQDLVEEMQGFLSKKAEIAAKTGQTIRDIAEARKARISMRDIQEEAKQQKLKTRQMRKRFRAGLPIEAPKETRKVGAGEDLVSQFGAPSEGAPLPVTPAGPAPLPEELNPSGPVQGPAARPWRFAAPEAPAGPPPGAWRAPKGARTTSSGRTFTVRQ